MTGCQHLSKQFQFFYVSIVLMSLFISEICCFDTSSKWEDEVEVQKGQGEPWQVGQTESVYFTDPHRPCQDRPIHHSATMTLQIGYVK